MAYTITINDNSQQEEAFKEMLIERVKEVKAIREGKIQARDLEEVLNEVE